MSIPSCLSTRLLPDAALSTASMAVFKSMFFAAAKSIAIGKCVIDVLRLPVEIVDLAKALLICADE